MDTDDIGGLADLLSDSRAKQWDKALLVRSSNITIIGDSSKIEALYKEYNTKYPTKDRKIEETISEPEMGFYFKF